MGGTVRDRLDTRESPCIEESSMHGDYTAYCIECIECTDNVKKRSTLRSSEKEAWQYLYRSSLEIMAKKRRERKAVAHRKCCTREETGRNFAINLIGARKRAPIIEVRAARW